MVDRQTARLKLPSIEPTRQGLNREKHQHAVEINPRHDQSIIEIVHYSFAVHKLISLVDTVTNFRLNVAPQLCGGNNTPLR